MPKNTNKTAQLKRRPKRARKQPQRPKKTEKTKKTEYPSYIMKDGETTHVILPIEEWDRIQHEEAARDAIRILEDPNTEWVNFDDMLAEEIGRRVAEARKAQGLTQTALAKKLGMQQAQISRIENNPDSTKLATLKKIAKALKVDLSKLVG